MREFLAAILVLLVASAAMAADADPVEIQLPKLTAWCAPVTLSGAALTEIAAEDARDSALRLVDAELDRQGVKTSSFPFLQDYRREYAEAQPGPSDSPIAVSFNACVLVPIQDDGKDPKDPVKRVRLPARHYAVAECPNIGTQDCITPLRAQLSTTYGADATRTAIVLMTRSAADLTETEVTRAFEAASDRQTTEGTTLNLTRSPVIADKTKVRPLRVVQEKDEVDPSQPSTAKTVVAMQVPE